MSGPHSRMSYEAFSAEAGAVQAALGAISKAVEASGLEKDLTELVKLRVSQINGCAFCVQIHLNFARRLAVPAHKLDLVAAWREAGVFSDRERAALAWAEILTALAPGAASDADYSALLRHFTESEAMYLTVAIGAINNWNRIGVAMRFSPPIPSRTADSAA
jgi:AhpD family alkylhydroperoxidase